MRASREANSRRQHRLRIRCAGPRVWAPPGQRPTRPPPRRAELTPTTSGMGAEVTVFGGAMGSISFPAAGSGGAIIDFDAISDVRRRYGPEHLRRLAPLMAPEPRRAPGPWRPPVFFLPQRVLPAATGDTTGAGEDFGAVAGASAGAAACGGVTAGSCRTIAPVTESSPCSRTATREYSRSRSLFNVSIAEARRRPRFGSPWRPTESAAAPESAEAICSRRIPIDDWLASSAMMTAPTDAAAHDPSRQSVRRSNSSSSATSRTPGRRYPRSRSGPKDYGNPLPYDVFGPP